MSKELRLSRDDFPEVDWEAIEKDLERYKNCTHVWLADFSKNAKAGQKRCFHCKTVSWPT